MYATMARTAIKGISCYCPDHVYFMLQPTHTPCLLQPHHSNLRSALPPLMHHVVGYQLLCSYLLGASKYMGYMGWGSKWQAYFTKAIDGKTAFPDTKYTRLFQKVESIFIKCIHASPGKLDQWIGSTLKYPISLLIHLKHTKLKIYCCHLH